MPSDQPGLFGALLIALAGGWAASRILRSPAQPFQAMGLGVAGALLGMGLAGALGVRANAVWLLAAAICGGIGVLAAWRFISHRLARRCERNLGRTDELENQDTQEGPS